MTDADVYKAGRLAGHLIRRDDGVEFRYTTEYLASRAPAVASTLPLDDLPRVTPAGAVPPFFAGLLPEGRRLTSLQRTLKASADDELTLLLAVGGDPIGDVQIVPRGAPAIDRQAVAVEKSFSEITFSSVLSESGIIDPVGIAGVQEKVSARMLNVPIRRAGERYILKLSPPEYPHVVENELHFIRSARRLKLRTVKASLVHDSEGRAGLLVVRFDRETDAAGQPIKLAQEDACQLLDRWPADKYNVSMEDVARATIGQTTAPAVAARDVFRQVVFAWLTGNGDLHAKNLSMLELTDGERIVAPAYDLPSTAPYGDLTFALELQGRTDGFSRKIMLDFAHDVGLIDRVAETTLDRMLTALPPADQLVFGLPFDGGTLATVTKRLAYRRRLLSLGR